MAYLGVRKAALFVLIGLVLGGATNSRIVRSGQIAGRIVEAGSGAAVGDAIIVARWIIEFDGMMHSSSHCVRAEAIPATTTGRFTVPAWRGLVDGSPDFAAVEVMAFSPSHQRQQNFGVGHASLSVPSCSSAEIRMTLADRSSESDLKDIKSALDWTATCHSGDLTPLYREIKKRLDQIPVELRTKRAEADLPSVQEQFDNVAQANVKN